MRVGEFMNSILSRIPATVVAIPLLAMGLVVRAEEQIPGETYTPDLIGPSLVESYADRQSQGVGQGAPSDGETVEIPLATEGAPAGEPIPQPAPTLTGSLPTLTRSFQGATQKSVDPRIPDTMGAIGPDHFMEVVNSGVSIFSKSDGTLLASERLSSFFSGIGMGSTIGDPRVLFDHHSNRWIVIASDLAEGKKIALAVSLSSDPLGPFFKTQFLAAAGSDTNSYPDYPTLGVDENGIYIGAFMVGIGMTMWAIDKAPLIASTPGMGRVTAWRSGGIAMEWSLGNQPAHTYGSPGLEYIVGKHSQSSLRIWGVFPPLTSPVLNKWDITVESFSRPPEAPALGSSVPINTVGDRLMMSVYRNGSLWTTHCINVNGRAGIRWYEIDPVTLSVIQWGNVADDSLHYYDPSLMVNSAGHVAVAFSGSDGNQYVGSYYTGRRTSDAPGDMAVPRLFKSGEAPYQRLGPDSLNRWGDYSYTTLDPVDESTFWTIQEYAETPIQNGSAWGTWIGVLRFVPCTLVGDCEDANECTHDECVDGLCENIPIPDSTLCAGGVCCAGQCVCSSDAQCDDGVVCTTDVCAQVGTCDAHCENMECDPVTPNGCCGPTCTPCDDFDCRSANEVLGSTCEDGIDNDCDGSVDCEDLADCADGSACSCDDHYGLSPLVCVKWDGGLPPQANQDFRIDTVSDPGNPNATLNPNVTLYTENDDWWVWSQVSRTNNAPGNLGHIRIDPALNDGNYSVTIARGSSAGAVNVASILLVKEGPIQSSLTGGAIAGDLTGDLVVQESGGQGGAVSFTIGGNLGGNVTIPAAGSFQVNGDVQLNATITLGSASGTVDVLGVFDGDICGANITSTAPLPSNIQIAEFGSYARICGQYVCGTALQPSGDTILRNRTLAFSPVPIAAPGVETALQVRLVDFQNPNPPNPPCCPPQNFDAFEVGTCTAELSQSEGGGCVRWVGAVETFYETQDNHALGSYHAGRLQCTPYYRDWSGEGAVQIIGAEILPSSTYQLRMISHNEATCSQSLMVTTGRWGDVGEPFAPNGTQPDSGDVVAVVNKFRNQPGAPTKSRAQLQPNAINPQFDVGALDIVSTIDGFRGSAYPYSGPCPCPSSFICSNPTKCKSNNQCSNGSCFKTCGGDPGGPICVFDTNCVGVVCGNPQDAENPGFCRDKCGRCR